MTDITQGQAPVAVRVERSPKRVRVLFGGRMIADSARPLLVWEHRYYPTYYFPAADVDATALTPTGETSSSAERGDAAVHTVTVGERTAPGAALSYPDSPVAALRDTVRLDWAAMDGWFEEDEQVYVHARSPYTRVDILDSSRTVRVEIDGVVVAESSRPLLLFETGLRTRYYLPRTDVRLDLLSPTDTSTSCPYKGTAQYWSANIDGTVYPDVVWSYPTALPESQKIAGRMAFWDEKVTVYVDGVRQD